MPLIVILAVAMAACPFEVAAQESATRPFGTTRLWDINIGNPQAVGTGATFVIGQKWDTGPAGRANRVVRGALVASSVGFGGLTARVAWTRLHQYDVVAAADGWSVEAVYSRPWLLQWGLRRNTNYLGGGLTFRSGLMQFSAALLTDVSTNASGTVVAVSAGMSIAEF